MHAVTKSVKIEFDSLFNDTFEELVDKVDEQFPDARHGDLIVEIEDGRLVISQEEV